MLQACSIFQRLNGRKIEIVNNKKSKSLKNTIFYKVEDAFVFLKVPSAFVYFITQKLVIKEKYNCNTCVISQLTKTLLVCSIHIRHKLYTTTNLAHSLKYCLVFCR